MLTINVEDKFYFVLNKIHTKLQNTEFHWCVMHKYSLENLFNSIINDCQITFLQFLTKVIFSLQCFLNSTVCFSLLTTVPVISKMACCSPAQINVTMFD